MAELVQFKTGLLNDYVTKYGNKEIGDGVLFFSTDTFTIWKAGHLYGLASLGDGITWKEILARYDGAFVEITPQFTESNGWTFSFIDAAGNSSYSIGITPASSEHGGLMSAADKAKLDSMNPDNYVLKEAGKGLSTNDYTNEDKDKLATIEEGALVNIVEEIKVDGIKVMPTNKAVNLPITLMITDTVGSKLTSAYEYKGSVDSVEELPSNPKVGDVYNITVKSIYGEAGVNVAWNGDSWDSLGGIFDTTSITNSITGLDTRLTTAEETIETLGALVATNTASLTTLNSDIDTEGSVRYTSNEIATLVVTNYLTWGEL